MYKYIITWVITSIISEPTPARIDEFGVIESSGISLAVYNYSTLDEQKTRVFKDRDSALAFYKRGKSNIPEYPIPLGQYMSSIKIDSLLIKTNNNE